MADELSQIMLSNQPIIFFDGVCNLCNSSVQFVIKNDKHHYFRFASLQSEFTPTFFAEHQFEITSDSIILFYNNKFYEKSSAALIIAKHLSFPVNALIVFWIIPAFIRNWIYTIIAKNRYRWFGKKDSCMIPAPELKSLFLD